MNKLKLSIIISSSLVILSLIIFLCISIYYGYDFINFKTIQYKRSEICNKDEFDNEFILEKNLYQILGTTDYSEKIYFINNYNLELIELKSYKNKPGNAGKAKIIINDCNNNKQSINGRYKKINNYIVIYNDNYVYLFVLNKKNNILQDYYNNLKESKIIYNFIKG